MYTYISTVLLMWQLRIYTVTRRGKECRRFVEQIKFQIVRKPRSGYFHLWLFQANVTGCVIKRR